MVGATAGWRRPLGLSVAFALCAARGLGPLWTGDDPCCQHNANRREGEALVHELFHLLGFKHYFDQHELTSVPMSPGALDRPGTTGSLTYYAAWTDIENRRCIFPKGG